MSGPFWPVPEAVAAQLSRRAHLASMLFAHVFPDQDRSDLAQDALTALLKRWRAGQTVAEPSVWLVATMRHMHASRRRIARRRGETASTSRARGDSAATNIEPASRPDPWADLDRRLADLALTDADKDILRDLASGETRRAIAAGRGISVRQVEGTVKKILERARFCIDQSEGKGG